MALTPKGNFIGIIAGVLIATIVSFLIASFILKLSKDNSEEELEDSIAKAKEMKQEGKSVLSQALAGPVNLIVFACDAGLGSSALGATAFKKKLDQIGMHIEVKHFAIEKVPTEADIIVTHRSLLERTRLKFADRRIITIDNFINDPVLDQLLEEFRYSKA